MKRRGSVLVLVAAATAMLMAAGALVVDLGAGLDARTRAQAATDAGALAAAYHLAGKVDSTAATASALDWAGRNGLAAQPGGVSIWYLPDGTPAVTVRATQHVETAFARVVGINGYDVAVASSAALRSVSELPRGAVPIGVPARKTKKGEWEVMAQPSASDNLVTIHDGHAPTFKFELPASGKRGGGNFLPLAIDGADRNSFLATLQDGTMAPIPLGTRVPKVSVTVDDVEAGIRARYTRPDGATLLVPLVNADDWFARDALPDAEIIGVIAIRINSISSQGQIVGQYDPTVIYTAAHAGPDGG